MTDTAAGPPAISFDHAGLVVPDLDAAVAFYTRAFGMTVLLREADTDVDADAIGLPGEMVRLRGAILHAGPGVRFELHQYLSPTGEAPRRVSDLGIGHIAFSVDDIHAAAAHLQDEGVTWNTTPHLIEEGALSGRWWVYGRDPWGNVIELGQDPR